MIVIMCSGRSDLLGQRPRFDYSGHAPNNAHTCGQPLCRHTWSRRSLALSLSVIFLTHKLGDVPTLLLSLQVFKTNTRLGVLLAVTDSEMHVSPRTWPFYLHGYHAGL